MAKLYCLNYGFTNPFGADRLVWKDAHEKTELATLNEAKEKVKEATLLRPTAKALLDKIDVGNNYRTEIKRDSLLKAIAALKDIEQLGENKMLTEQEVADATAMVLEKYADLDLTPDELEKIQLLSDQAVAKANLKELYKLKDIDKLRDGALSFLYKGADQLNRAERSLEESTTYTATFKDLAGKLNISALKYVTFGHVFKKAGIKKAKITQPDGTEVTGYLCSSDNNVYSKPIGSERPQGRSSKYYVRLLEGSKITVESETTDATLARDTSRVEARLSDAEEHYLDGYSDAGTDTRPLNIAEGDTPPLEIRAFTGKTVDVPDKIFKESLDNISLMENGPALIEAIQVIEAVNYKMGHPLDSKRIWEGLHGGITSRGGRDVISFNEMCKIAYGVPEDKMGEIADEKGTLQPFLKACDTIFNTMPQVKRTGITIEMVRRAHENRELTDDQKKMSAFLGKGIFDQFNYGPIVAPGLLKWIPRLLSSKDLPVINEMNWMDRQIGEAWDGPERQNYGELEIISQAQAFDKMLDENDMNAFLLKLNEHMEVGKTHVNELAKLPGVNKNRTGLMGAIYPDILTMVDLERDDFDFTQDQIVAIRHGAMIEAAGELGSFRAIKEATPESAETAGDNNSVAKELVAQMIAKKQIPEKERRDWERRISHGLKGVFGAQVMTQDLEKFDAAAVLGVTQELGNGFSLGFSLVDEFPVPNVFKTNDPLGENIYPQVRLGYVTRRFGKNGKWQFKGHATLENKAWEEINLGPSAGASLKYDFKTGGELAAVLGASSGLESFGLMCGVERDLGRVLDKRIAKYKEENPDKIEEATKEVFDAIDNKGLSKQSSRALKYGYMTYLDSQLAFGVASDDADAHWIKWKDAGLDLAAGYKEGVAVGPYISFTLFSRPVMMRMPTEEVMNARLAGDDPIELMIEAGGDSLTVNIHRDDIVYSDPEEADAAKGKAVEQQTEMFNEINAGLKKNVVLTPDKDFTSVEFPGINGYIELYSDPDSGIEVIQSYNGKKAYLNLEQSDHLVLRIFNKKESSGAERSIVVITNDRENVDVSALIDPKNAHLSWTQYQTEDKVKKSSIRIVGEKSATSNIYEEAMFHVAAYADEVDLEYGFMSKGGAEKAAKQADYEALKNAPEISGADLFNDLTIGITNNEARKAENLKQWNACKVAATRLIKQDKVKYTVMVTGDQDDEIDAKLKEYIKQNLGDDASITSKHIDLARQFATEFSRPNNIRQLTKWNKDAFESEIKSSEKTEGGQKAALTELANKYIDAIKDGKIPTGTFPEGAEFKLYAGANRKHVTMGGYYDKDIYGLVSGAMVWDKNKPEKVLNALDMETTDENKALIRSMAAMIEDMPWEENQYNRMENDTFEAASNTTVGLLLLREAKKIYGDDAGTKLNAMKVTGVGTDTESVALADQYKKDVHALLTNKKAVINGTPVLMENVVVSGLLDECFNLMLGKAPVLKYAKTSHEFTAEVRVNEIRSGLTSRAGTTGVTVKAQVIPSINPERTMAEAGESDQNTGTDPYDPGYNPGATEN